MNIKVLDEKAIFNIAVNIGSADARGQYLEQACVDHPEIRQRIEVLLRMQEEEPEFLEIPADGGQTCGFDFGGNEQSGQQIGPYRLLEVIGEGGMGVVFLAEQDGPAQRQVALKLIKPGMGTRNVIARFEAEKQTLALMDHPGIAKVFDAGATESGRPYFVMELINGIPIHKFCDQHRLDTKQRLDLFMQVCQGVQHAHQKGIIHRDLKPSNILVAMNDNQPVPKIIDFGVAKATGPERMDKTTLTRIDQVIGTLEYMSPEQTRGEPLDIDTRADIYALGAILYELLTGSPPFELARMKNQAFDETLRMIREEEPTRPSTKLGSSVDLERIAQNRHTQPQRLSALVHGDLDWIVMKALEKDRTRRYPSASAFAADIERFLKNETVEACPPSRAYRLKKFARRNRVALTTTALVAAALLVATGVSIWQAIEARSARYLADQRLVAEQAARQEASDNLLLAQDAAEQERIQRERAEENFRQARAAVDTYLTKVSEDQLLNEPLMQPLRKELLELALEYYQQFIEQQPDDPELQADLADAYSRVGRIIGEIGSEEESLAAHQKALEIRDQLVSLHPTDLTYLRDLGGSKTNIGRSYMKLGQLDRGQEFLSDAVAIGESLVAQDPDFIDCQHNLAISYNLLAALNGKLGRYALAKTLLEKAIAIRERLVEENPEVVSSRCDLSNSFHNLALVYRSLDETDQAIDLHTKAITIRRQLVDQHPEVMRYQSALASSYSCLSVIYQTCLGQPEQALVFHRMAIPIEERLVKENPEVNEFGSRLASSYNNLSGLYQTCLGRPEEALVILRKAISIRERLVKENPEVNEFGSRLARSYNNAALIQSTLGKPVEALVLHRKALTIEDRLAAENPEVVQYQYALAVSYNTMGLMLNELGQQEEARVSFSKATTIQERLVEKNPANTSYRTSLAVYYLMFGNELRESGDEKAAAEIFTKLVNLVGPEETIGALWGYAGQAHYQLGNWQQAREALELAIEMWGNTGPTSMRGVRWWYLAMTLHQLGEVELARSYFDQLVEELEQNSTPFGSKPVHIEAAEVFGIEIPNEDDSDQSTENGDF